MHSAKEPDSFFGGMAAPKWNSEGDYIEDASEECSWLFKLEAGKKKYFYLVIIVKELIFINGNALAIRALFLGIKVYLFF